MLQKMSAFARFLIRLGLVVDLGWLVYLSGMVFLEHRLDRSWLVAGLLLAVWLVPGERACGLEVDCQACNFCRSRPDIGDEVTQRIKGHLAAGKSVEEIAMLEGGQQPSLG